IGTIKASGRKLLQVHGSELAKSMTWEESFHEPDRLKRVIRQNFMGQSSTFTYLYRDGKLWSRMDDREVMVQDMDSAVLDNLTSFLGQLVEMHQKRTPLKLLGEEIVANRKAIGIEAHSNEPGKLQLFFDKDSAWLVKMVKYAPDDEKATQQII